MLNFIRAPSERVTAPGKSQPAQTPDLFSQELQPDPAGQAPVETRPEPQSQPETQAQQEPQPAAKPTGQAVQLSAAAGEYAAMTRRKRELEKELNFLKEDLARREGQLADTMTAEGVQQLKTAEGATVYLNEAVFASLVKDPDGETAGALAALKAQELGWMVKETVNTNTLRSWVKEVEKSNGALPPAITPWVKVSRLPRVGVRSS